MKIAPVKPWPILAIWLAFLLRGAFYCVEQPLWEGFDEWAHFAYVQHVAQHGSLPARSDLVSDEVRRSLVTTPLAPYAARISPRAITHDEYWQLPPNQRLRTAIEPLPDARQYEAQQPPLYYFLLAPVLLLFRTATLHTQVIALRLAGTLIASIVVFLAYASARRANLSNAMSLLTAAFLACLPGFFIDVCRVSNDSLAIALTSAAILCALQDRRLAMGALLGLGLLTKSYALAFLPLLFFPMCSGKQTVDRASGGLAVALVLGGWWSVKMWIATGTLSGEQLDAAASRFTLVQKLAAIAHLHWTTVLDIAAFSHIWMGGWSFLTLRSWMYRAVEAIALAAAVSLAIHLYRRRERPTIFLAAAFALNCAVLFYFALIAFIAQNAETANGWYLYPAIVPEAVLLMIGLRTRALATCVCLSAAALDLYGMNRVLMPYYAGLQHQPANWGLMFQRLDVSPALWAAYLVATLALAALSLGLTRQRESARM